MYKFFALLAAICLAGIGVASSTMAANVGELGFTLSGTDRVDRVQLTLRDGRRSGMHSSSSYRPNELAGLNTDALRAGSGAIGFALVRDAGRVDCRGAAQRAGHAGGQCDFKADPRFAALLASRGIEAPDEEEALGLTLVGATSALVNAVADAGYTRVSADDLTGLAALGVTPAYIGELARGGYKPANVGDLLAFKALDISPSYVAALGRQGYGRIPASELIQLKALDITPEFIRGFREAGYPALPVATLIQAKALNVTPEFVRSLRPPQSSRLSADELIRLKVAGLMP
ncbi:hypothetical protein OMW55_02145 [Sphingomonas sp. BN140010]|uniref:Uncharacterized protein n=1 Tax=Sphingomonas arvum TaxID=2992113 RepID=A0ABT3JC17_9SPHN|nr:hypothetical protein [Sphingomonas sp. BN140010]MCW3796611.1 hypothetical protein [Sphingomonas sp. BN140010]